MTHSAPVNRSERERGGARRTLLLLIQAGVSIAACAYLFRVVHPSATWEAFRDATWVLLAVAPIPLFIDLHLRAVRWRWILAEERPLSHQNLFGASNVGYLVNNVLPFRLGEIARIAAMHRLERTGAVRSTASVFVERGMDLVAMVALILLLFPFVDEPGWARGPALLLGSAVITAVICVALFARLHASGHDRWRRMMERLPRIGSRLLTVTDEAVRGVAPLLRPLLFLRVLALTIVIWGFAWLCFFVTMRAFGLPDTATAAALILGATTLGMVVPSSPGYVGVFHAIAVETLTHVFGIPREEALSYALAQHAIIVIVPSLLGLLFLVRRPQLWRTIRASLRHELHEREGMAAEHAQEAAP